MLRITKESTCLSNTLTKNAEVPSWEYIVSSSSLSSSKSPSFTRLVSNCKVHQKLYFFDDASNTWIDYAADNTKYPFVSSFVNGENTANTDIGKLTIVATRSTVNSSFWKPSKMYRVKITLNDPLANG